MNWADILAIILGLAGLVGCIVPILPGPPFTWAGLLLIYIWGHEAPAMTPTFLWVWCGITYLYELDGYDHGAMADPDFHILESHLKKLLQP